MSAAALDMTILAILVLSAVIAFMRGFIKEVLTIAGLVGATVAAYTVGPMVHPWISDLIVGEVEGKGEEKKMIWNLIPADVMATALSHGGVFVVTFIVLTILSFFISRVAQEMGLNFMDRSLGVVFGLARGLALLVLLYLPFSIMLTEEEFPKWTKESRTLPVLAYSVDKVYAYLDIDTDKKDKEREKTADKAFSSFTSLFKGDSKDEKKDEKDSGGFFGYKKDDRGDMEKLFDRSSKTVKRNNL